MVFRRILAEWSILLACLAALGVFAAHAELTHRLDAQLVDRAANLARNAASDDILIVAIDDASLAEIGPWPWPRSTHAKLVDRLTEARSGTVLYDVLFLDPTDAAQDETLGAAMARHGQVVLPFTFTNRINTVDEVEADYPVPPISGGAAALGHVAIDPDDDGVLRRFDMQLRIGAATFPHFVRSALEIEGHDVARLPEQPLLSFLPVDAYSRISAAEVIAGRVPRGFIEDRTILVGATAQGMGDRYSVGGREVELMSGVETQANLIDAARTGGFVNVLSNWWAAALAVAALLAQFLVFWRLSPRAGLLATIIIAALVLCTSVLLVPLAGIWVAPGAALLVVLLGYPFWSWRRLTSVSAYLEEEAAFLRPEGAKKANVEGFDQIARQVSRMRRLVSNVSKSFEFMRTVIEAAPDAILVLDREGVVTMANRKAQYLFPDFDEAVTSSLSEMLLANAATEDAERQELSFPGGRTFLVARAQFEVEDGAQGGEIMALRDVSDIRQREQERREMLEFLSHDMRTPQVAIIGLSRRMEKDGAGGDVGSRIRTQAERTLKLADDFVQLARLSEQQPEFEEWDVAALVEEASDRAYTSARQKLIAIVPSVPSDPVYAVIDASLIARLLDNLIGNAIKFSPNGSEIHVSLKQPLEDSFVLEVSDKGAGLSPERLRDPFARFGAHENEAGPSVGLGLAFVKRVVDLHGGTITVRSEPAQGTSFTVEIAAVRPALT